MLGCVLSHAIYSKNILPKKQLLACKCACFATSQIRIHSHVKTIETKRQMKPLKFILFLVVYCALITIFCLIFLNTTDILNGFPSIKNISKLEKSCGRYPVNEDVTVDNLYWQILEHSKGFVNIFNAYLDLRQNKSVIRINVLSKLLNESDEFYCQFWNDKQASLGVIKATEVLLMWGE